MANFAILDARNIVTEIIVADSLEVAQQIIGANCVELLPEASLGDTWDGKQFIKVEVENAAV